MQSEYGLPLVPPLSRTKVPPGHVERRLLLDRRPQLSERSRPTPAMSPVASIAGQTALASLCFGLATACHENEVPGSGGGDQSSASSSTYGGMPLPPECDASQTFGLPGCRDALREVCLAHTTAEACDAQERALFREFTIDCGSVRGPGLLYGGRRVLPVRGRTAARFRDLP